MSVLQSSKSSESYRSSAMFDRRCGGWNIVNAPGPYAAHVYRHIDGGWAVTDGWGVDWPKRYPTRRMAAWYVMASTEAPFGDPHAPGSTVGDEAGKVACEACGAPAARCECLGPIAATPEVLEATGQLLHFPGVTIPEPDGADRLRRDLETFRHYLAGPCNANGPMAPGCPDGEYDGHRHWNEWYDGHRSTIVQLNMILVGGFDREQYERFVASDREHVCSECGQFHPNTEHEAGVVLP